MAKKRKPMKKPLRSKKSTAQQLKETRAKAGGVAANKWNASKSGKLKGYKRKGAAQQRTDRILHENAQRAVKRQEASKKKTAKKKTAKKKTAKKKGIRRK